MSLGETIDGVIERHLASPYHDPPACVICGENEKIQTAYEEMIQSLKVLDSGTPNPPPMLNPKMITPIPELKTPWRQVVGTFTKNRVTTESDESYESVLPRDPDFQKEEAA